MSDDATARPEHHEQSARIAAHDHRDETRSERRWAIIAVVAGLTALLLIAVAPIVSVIREDDGVGDGVTGVKQRDSEWLLVAQGGIAPLSHEPTVYLGRHARNQDDHGGLVVLDYAFSRQMNDGSTREDLVSSTYEHVTGVKYPGDSVVLVRNDIPPRSEERPSIKVFLCPNDMCEMPDGTRVKAEHHYIEIHVPIDSRVQDFTDDEFAEHEKTMNNKYGPAWWYHVG